MTSDLRARHREHRRAVLDGEQRDSLAAEWTGHDARALRRARRMSVREFAAHLGVSDRMVSKWESAGENLRPRPFNQRVLDESLRRVDRIACARFHALRENEFDRGDQG